MAIQIQVDRPSSEVIVLANEIESVFEDKEGDNALQFVPGGHATPNIGAALGTNSDRLTTLAASLLAVASIASMFCTPGHNLGAGLNGSPSETNHVQ